jgi:hypothetical protein
MYNCFLISCASIVIVLKFLQFVVDKQCVVMMKCSVMYIAVVLYIQVRLTAVLHFVHACSHYLQTLTF